MALQFKRVDRAFSPADAERITGVSVALQRDWRRRGILAKTAPGKWTQFKLHDIIEMATKKIFADAGYSVHQVADIAAMSILPTLRSIEAISGAVGYRGHALSNEQRDRSELAGSVHSDAGRYLAMTRDHVGEVRVVRIDDLAKIDRLLEKAKSAQCTVLDCCILAATIAERAGLPVWEWEVTETKRSK
ncbi:hypothetical protein [Dongia sp.]|uniref:hypothetical protein n=1 Tax=Dongia sp. TaxID=1977262 RepID=UPI0035B4B759